MDVCATKENHKCSYWITKEKDGLKLDWFKRNWMNPPYGREIGKWVQRAYEEVKMGNLTVALLPARTDTKWFHDYIYNPLPYLATQYKTKPIKLYQIKPEIRFIKGRLKFEGGKNSAPFPSMIVIFK